MVGIVFALPIGVSILSTYLEPYLPTTSYAIWIAVVLAHIVLIVYFTIELMITLDVMEVLQAISRYMSASRWGGDSTGLRCVCD